MVLVKQLIYWTNRPAASRHPALTKAGSSHSADLRLPNRSLKNFTPGFSNRTEPLSCLDLQRLGNANCHSRDFMCKAIVSPVRMEQMAGMLVAMNNASKFCVLRLAA